MYKGVEVDVDCNNPYLLTVALNLFFLSLKICVEIIEEDMG